MDTELIAVNLEFQLLDKDGKPNGGPISVPTGSWTKQMAQHMHRHFGNTSVTLVKDTGGTDRTLPTPDGNDDMLATAAIADATRGIVAGTSTQALSETDNALISKIVEGASAGQFNYQASTVSSSVTAITGGYRFQFIRTVQNNSGGTITIEEVGLIIRSTSSAWLFLTLRDLATLAVLDATSAVITYSIDFLV